MAPKKSGKSGSAPSSQPEQPWSDWLWDEPREFWYKERIHEQGFYEYLYDDRLTRFRTPQSGSSAAQQPQSSMPNSPCVGSSKSSKTDKRFKKYKQACFLPGTVFKMPWHEMIGSKETWIRSFVVINQGGTKGFWGLPIHTYSQQGTLGQGDRAMDHAVVYTSKKPPSLLSGEKLTKRPIQIKPAHSGPEYELHKTSRLNYGRLYTFEYSVRVQITGDVCKKDIKQFIVDYNATRGIMNDLGGGWVQESASYSETEKPITTSRQETAFLDSLPQITSPFVHNVHIYGPNPAAMKRGVLRMDTANEAPSLITDEAMYYVGAVPTNTTFAVQSYGNANASLGGEVAITFQIGSNDRYYTETFRHVPSIPGGYTMLLNDRMCAKLLFAEVPGVNSLVPGKEPEQTPEEKRKAEEAHTLEVQRQEEERQRDLGYEYDQQDDQDVYDEAMKRYQYDQVNY